SPARMELAGAARHRRSPEGVSFREKANQSNLRSGLPLSWPTLWHAMSCPRREWSRWEASDIDEAPQGEFSGESESIEPSCCITLPLANPPEFRAMSPVGIEPTTPARIWGA